MNSCSGENVRSGCGVDEQEKAKQLQEFYSQLKDSNRVWRRLCVKLRQGLDHWKALETLDEGSLVLQRCCTILLLSLRLKFLRNLETSYSIHHRACSIQCCYFDIRNITARRPSSQVPRHSGVNRPQQISTSENGTASTQAPGLWQ